MRVTKRARRGRQEASCVPGVDVALTSSGQSSVSPTSSWSRRSVFVVLGAGAAAVAIAAVVIIGSSHPTPTEKVLPDSHRNVPERLVFAGIINGAMTEGINAQGMRHAAPNPSMGFGVFAQTSCTIFMLGNDNGSTGGNHEWEADIYGMVSGTPVVVRLGLEDKPIAGQHQVFTQLTTDGQAVLQSVDGKIELDHPGPTTSTFTVNADQTSGVLNLALSGSPYSPTVDETITGDWRCL